MKVEQIYTGCLAEAAYYIESEGEVALLRVKPVLLVQEVVQLALSS